MRPNLEAALIRDFPGLFADYGKPVTQTCISFGCEVGEGWEPILRNAFAKLACLRPQPVLDQVKEKYGTLRIYYHGGPERRRRWFGWMLWLPGLLRGLWWWMRPLGRERRGLWRSLQWAWDSANWLTYWHAHDDVEAIIDQAERESTRTCEACGRPGKLNERGWLSVRCEECRKEQRNG